MVSRKVISAVTITLAIGLPTSVEGKQTSYPKNLPSKRNVMIRSAVIPGLGELAIGKTNRGKLFAEVELGFWLALVESYWAVERNQSRLESYAAVHAGIELKGRGSKFLVDVGDYMSTDIYNEEQQRQRSPSNIYPHDKRYQWLWDSIDHRKQFRQFRISRDRERKFGRFIIAGMVLNRLISVIDVSYLHNVQQNRSEISLSPLQGLNGHGFNITLIYWL